MPGAYDNEYTFMHFGARQFLGYACSLRSLLPFAQLLLQAMFQDCSEVDYLLVQLFIVIQSLKFHQHNSDHFITLSAVSWG